MRLQILDGLIRQCVQPAILNILFKLFIPNTGIELLEPGTKRIKFPLVP